MALAERTRSAIPKRGSGEKFQLFIPVDSRSFDWSQAVEWNEVQASGKGVEIDPEDFLVYLPELEQEIFFMVFVKGKRQTDVAELLGVSQPTISYRSSRILDKLSYLLVLMSVDVKSLVGELDFLKLREQQILIDLLELVNQEMTGRRHGVGQSSVKWIFLKTLRRLRKREKRDPEKWYRHFALIKLLDQNLTLRIKA